VKNKNNKISVESGLFTLQLAVEYLQNVGISTKGLLEVILRTGNAELAMQVLADKYKTPNLPKQVKLKESVCTMISFDPWLNDVNYSYERNKSKHIYVNADKLEEGVVINYENYKDHEVNWSASKNPKGITICFPEMETITDSCCLATWMEAEMIVPAQVEFSRENGVNYTID